MALVQDVIGSASERSRNRERRSTRPAGRARRRRQLLAALPQLDQYAATAGGYGVQLVTTFRHLSQMRARYDERAEAVLSNHLAKVILSGVTDAETLAHLSHLLGDETIRQLATPAALAKAAKDRGEGAEAAWASRSRGGLPGRGAGLDLARPRGAALRPPSAGPDHPASLVPRPPAPGDGQPGRGRASRRCAIR